MEKMRFLIKACFLRELGFSDDKILNLFERNALYPVVFHKTKKVSYSSFFSQYIFSPLRCR
jgi:hypothetical protein